ncbi:MAG: glycosyltransferase family 39 protein [Deltaproteobacteria bacterium]|nr:glycosyltransferase family 39 protein [Deltaproteobacteria bacterium]
MTRNRRSLSRSKPASQAARGAAPPLTIRAGKFWLAAPTIALLVFCLLAISSALRNSPTVDEPVHLFAGYSYLKWGDFRANPEHPPLAKLLAATPLLFLNIRDTLSLSRDWEQIPEKEPGLSTERLAHQMLFRANDAGPVFFAARIPLIVLAVTLGVFIYIWSRKLFGARGALVSLAVYSVDPNVLAHSQIIHTDLPFAAFLFIGSYFFWQTLRRVSVFNVGFAILFFGLASITKHSFLTLFPIWTVLGLIWIFSSDSGPGSSEKVSNGSNQRLKLISTAAILVGASIAAYVFTWAAYAFRFHAIPGGESPLAMAQVMPDSELLRRLGLFLAKYHLFPEAWIYGQLYIFKHLHRPAYLLGESSQSGFWLYFPVALAVKTTVPTLLLLVGALARVILGRGEKKSEFFLLVPAAIYLALAISSRMNIGIRHILPIYPFLFVWIGGIAVDLWQGKGGIPKTTLAFLMAWHFWSSLSIYPHYLSFFNELAGGAKNGHRVLLDSNLDWGQDLKGLKRWMDDQQVKKILFLYFGLADPGYYGIDALLLPGSTITNRQPPTRNPDPPSHIAISANFLYGAKVFLGGRQSEVLEMFRHAEPSALIGYSIYVYRLDGADARLLAYLGWLLAQRGEFKEAIEFFRRALIMQPDLPEAYEGLARVLALAGNPSAP